MKNSLSSRSAAFHLVGGAMLVAGLLLGSISVCPAHSDRTAPAKSQFQDWSDLYFQDRCLDFARELLLKEQFLSGLYNGTVNELKLRQSQGMDLSVLYSPLWNYQAAPFNRDDSAWSQTDLRERYLAWKQYEEQEYQGHLELILQIRAQMIVQGSAQQNERMFRQELETAMRYYGQSDWEMARLFFDHLSHDYGYQNIDDILYYQGQTCMQLGLLEAAYEQFQRLLETYPTSSYRAAGYDQVTAILENFGKGAQIRKVYSDYLEEKMPGEPAAMGGVHIRAAHAEIALGHYQPAMEILSRLQRGSPYYLPGQYLLADCLTAVKEWPRAIDVLLNMLTAKQKDLPAESWRLLKDETRIKLAYVYYESGNVEKAEKTFNELRDGSLFYDRVMLGKAWVAFQLDQYPEAIAKAENLLQRYPLSTEIYEAGALAGYCYEQMGDKNSAVARFLEVLDAGVGRSQLQSFLDEKRRLQQTMASLVALEEQVFSSGDEQLFSQYKRARDQVRVIQQRLGLAELLQVNSRMRALVEERVILDSLLQVHDRLEANVSQNKDAALLVDFLQVEDRIYTCLEHLNSVGQEQLESTPLYYQEAQIGAANSRADSLSRRLENELDHLDATIKAAEQLKEFAFTHDNSQGGLELGRRLDELTDVRDQTELAQTQARATRRPALMTRVDRWSDFSFSRYAMGGMDLEELDIKHERLRQVEEYIATLEQLLDDRQNEPKPEASAETP